jgi:hypothetical protein
MTIVGSRRMIVYDDVVALEKIKIYDARVETPPHYDTFAEFQYAYHYGDVYVPYIKQEEPLKVECQHFLDSIRNGTAPLSDGRQGLQLVQVLEASSESLKHGGGPVALPFRPNGSIRTNGEVRHNGNGQSNGHVVVNPMIEVLPHATANGNTKEKAPAPPVGQRHSLPVASISPP